MTLVESCQALISRSGGIGRLSHDEGPGGGVPRLEVIGEDWHRLEFECADVAGWGAVFVAVDWSTHATLVGRQQHPAARDVEAVLQDARHLLVEYRSGKKDALSADRLNPLFEKIGQALDSLDRPAGPQPERDRFWT